MNDEKARSENFGPFCFRAEASIRISTKLIIFKIRPLLKLRNINDRKQILEDIQARFSFN